MHPDKKTKYLMRIVLCLMVFVVVVLSMFLFQQYRHIQHLNYFPNHRSLFIWPHGTETLSVTEASSTQVWMTFDYINHIFALPAGYLQSTLNITDSRYPRITIKEYAEDLGLKEVAALGRVQYAISAYVPSNQ